MTFTVYNENLPPLFDSTKYFMNANGEFFHMEPMDNELVKITGDYLVTYNNSALTSVLAERKRQDTIWGEQNHGQFQWLSILTEELGEYAQELNDVSVGKGDIENVRTEAVQIASVALAIVECIDRKGIHL